MKERYQLVKDEIMHTINQSPEAMHSIGGLSERLKDRVTRTEIERAVACLLARQHIKKLGAYVFGLGTGEGITPYPLDNYNPDALPATNKPDQSNKQRIAEAERKRQEQAGQKKTFQNWAGGEKTPADKPAVPAVQTTQPPEQAKPPTSDQVNYALSELRDRLSAPRATAITDLPKKINTLEQLALILDPTIGSVLDQIKNDLKGIAA
jgi:hypothetical protein